MKKNNWEILGVSPGTSMDDLEKTYKTLVKKYHPDVNPGDSEAEARMKEITAAYADLKKGITGAEPAPEPPRQWTNGFSVHDIHDIFQELRGMGRHPRNLNIQVALAVPVTVLVRGGTAPLSYDRPDFSDGQIRFTRVSREVQIEPNHPLGEPLVFKQAGSIAGNSQPPGDLIVYLSPAGTKQFQVGHDGVQMVHEIDALSAMTGTQVELTMPSGKTMKVTIKPGTNHGSRLRLKQQGLQLDRAKRGDLFVVILVQVPVIDRPDLIAKIDELRVLMTAQEGTPATP